MSDESDYERSDREDEMSQSGSKRHSRFDKKKNAKKAPTYKFHPQDGRNNQTYFTFETVLENLVLRVKNKYNYGPDAAKSIQNLQKINLNDQMPVKTIALDEDVMTEQELNEDDSQLPKADLNKKMKSIALRKKNLQQSYDDLYKCEMDAFAKRKVQLPMTLEKTAGLILQEYCTYPMKTKLEQLSDYPTLRDDPIALLNAIRVMMHDTTRARNPVTVFHDLLTRFLRTSQQKNESLATYTKRFKDQKSNIESMIGIGLVTGYCEHLPRFKTLTTEKEKEEFTVSFLQEWTAYVMMKNANPKKYSDLLETLSTQYALDNPLYPADIPQAYDALNSHSPETNKNKNKNKHDNQKDQQDKKNETLPTSFFSDYMNMTHYAGKIHCYKCGETGHRSDQCERDDIKDGEWWIHKKIKEDAAKKEAEEGKNHSQFKKDPARRWKV